jgi:hypothetical protein
MCYRCSRSNDSWHVNQGERSGYQYADGNCRSLGFGDEEADMIHTSFGYIISMANVHYDFILQGMRYKRLLCSPMRPLGLLLLRKCFHPNLLILAAK